MHPELVAAKVVTMLLGFLIAYQAYRGYRVHGSRPLRYVAAGFLLISFGAVIEGVLFEVVGMRIYEAGAIQTSIVAVGMLFVLYSLYGADTLGGRRTGRADVGEDADRAREAE